MKPDIDVTSVPGWAIRPSRPPADTSGRSWTVIVLDEGASEIADRWRQQIAATGGESGMVVHRVTGIDAALTALRTDLAGARVGWRLMLAGSAQSCLVLRAEAVSLGVADDEITVATTDVAARSVRCVHCLTVTGARVAVEEVLPCSGCGRNLVVYYHVSRRAGAHLGFMVDAEAMPA
ncbi:dimethylamine monooxygenase subunit DmmA family protein [Mycobacterium sp. NPDC003323]